MKEVCSLLSFLWAVASGIAVMYELGKVVYLGGSKVLLLADSHYGLREMAIVRSAGSMFQCWWKLGMLATASFFVSGWFWGAMIVR
jgi:hypothetical protein